MKLICLFFFGISPFVQHAQLTQGQVYNYEIGDIIETLYTSNTLPVIYEHHTVTNKEVIGSAIKYTFLTRKKLAGPPPSYPINSQFATLLTVYPNSYANHHLPMYSCLPFQFETSIGSCNQSIWTKISDADTTCFEPPVWYSSLYENFGGPYYYGNDASNPGWFVRLELIYGKTQSGGECGTEYTWWIVPAPTPEPEPEVEPPTKQIVRILDLFGRETTYHANEVLFIFYDDGSMERICVLK